MGRVQSLATLREVRLRKWPAGRVSQLKLFLGHLQQAVGVSLAAQVEQSPRRTFSEFVPKIVSQDITTEVSYKEIRVFFEPPQGLKNLLFYEHQLSATVGFFNFDQFQSPEVFYVWPGLNEGETYFLRLRVVTKDGEVGPWSDVINVSTPFGQSYGLFDGQERTQRISVTNDNPWTPVYERDYTAIGGKAYYSVEYDVQAVRKWSPGFDPIKGNVEWSDLEFRWVENVGSTGVEADFVQKGRQFNVTSYASNFTFGSSGFYTQEFNVAGYATALVLPDGWVNARRGTFVQKFSTMESGDYTIRLESRMQDPRRAANDWVPVDSERTKVLYRSDAIVKIKNFCIFETLIDDGGEI